MHLDRKKQKQKKCQGSRMSTINRITNSADSRLKQNQTKCQAHPLEKKYSTGFLQSLCTGKRPKSRNQWILLTKFFSNLTPWLLRKYHWSRSVTYITEQDQALIDLKVTSYGLDLRSRPYEVTLCN